MSSTGITFVDKPADNQSGKPPSLYVSPDVAERSKYQQNIIRNYYENREGIALQKAQEIVTELYLSDGKKRQKQWERLAGHLAKLDVKQEQIDRLIQQDDPQLAAQLVTKLGKI